MVFPWQSKFVVSPHGFDSLILLLQLYLDYVECLKEIPSLIAVSQDALLDAAEAEKLERLQRTVPLLTQLLPGILKDRTNWRHNVCLARMLSRLLGLQLPNVSHLFGKALLVTYACLLDARY